MKIESGYYEIERGDKFNRYYSLMRVWIENKQKYVQIDHCNPEILDSDKERWLLEDVKIVQRFSGQKPVVISKPILSVEFDVEGGGHHVLSARNFIQFSKIFKLFPRLKKKLS